MNLSFVHSSFQRRRQQVNEIKSAIEKSIAHNSLFNSTCWHNHFTTQLNKYVQCLYSGQGKRNSKNSVSGQVVVEVALGGEEEKCEERDRRRQMKMIRSFLSPFPSTTLPLTN